MRTFTKAIGLSGAVLMLSYGSAQAASIPGLYNTGVDNAGVALPPGNGQVDPHYKILETNAVGYAGNQAVTYYNSAYPADDGDSRWISLASSGMPLTPDISQDFGGSYTTYRTTFDLTGFDLSTVTISGLFAADDGVGIKFNGRFTDFINNSNGTFTPFSLTSDFAQGINFLDFLVLDILPPTAFRVDNLVGVGERLRPPTTAVPEPGTWALMILGFGLAGAFVRRSRSRPTSRTGGRATIALGLG